MLWICSATLNKNRWHYRLCVGHVSMLNCATQIRLFRVARPQVTSASKSSVNFPALRSSIAFQKNSYFADTNKVVLQHRSGPAQQSMSKTDKINQNRRTDFLVSYWAEQRIETWTKMGIFMTVLEKPGTEVVQRYIKHSSEVKLLCLGFDAISKADRSWLENEKIRKIVST